METYACKWNHIKVKRPFMYGKDNGNYIDRTGWADLVRADDKESAVSAFVNYLGFKGELTQHQADGGKVVYSVGSDEDYKWYLELTVFKMV